MFFFFLANSGPVPFSPFPSLPPFWLDARWHTTCAPPAHTTVAPPKSASTVRRRRRCRRRKKQKNKAHAHGCDVPARAAPPSCAVGTVSKVLCKKMPHSCLAFAARLISPFSRGGNSPPSTRCFFWLARCVFVCECRPALVQKIERGFYFHRAVMVTFFKSKKERRVCV